MPDSSHSLNAIPVKSPTRCLLVFCKIKINFVWKNKWMKIISNILKEMSKYERLFSSDNKI